MKFSNPRPSGDPTTLRGVGGFAGRYAPPFPSHAFGAGPSPDGGPPVAAPAHEPIVQATAPATAPPRPSLLFLVAKGDGGMDAKGAMACGMGDGRIACAVNFTLLTL